MTMKSTKVTGPRFEHSPEPLGVGTARPRLSWMVSTPAPAWTQNAYEIVAEAGTGEFRGQSGRVESGESALVPWPFDPLTSRERVGVRVRVWGTDGGPTDWSETRWVEAGLLDADDWVARFVTPDWDVDPTVTEPGPLLRREFVVRPGLLRARLYVTALGLYEARLNGSVVGNDVLTPGWTSYNRRLRYQTYDVTALLREGRNAIGAMLADGWYRGRLGYNGGRRNIYGDRLAFLAQLEVVYSDESFDMVVTDSTWRASLGPIRVSDIYDGETHDARLEPPGWPEPGFDDTAWAGVRVLDRDCEKLVAPDGPPVRRTETIAPVATLTSQSGHTIVDFGQNLVGRVRITVQGRRGQCITLRHAEVLQSGELCTRPLRTAEATDRYWLAGGGSEAWEPRFTFHGFRYVQIDGWPGVLRREDLVAVVCHSDLERTGWFECSDPLINRLHSNVVWSMRGNFLDIPTDCPQRDERLGWTGDIQIFAPTASYLYDCAGFLTSWLADLTADQAEDGAVPWFVPNIDPGPVIPAAGWGDAATIVPWVLYHRFGDTGILARQFDSMRRWVDKVADLAGPDLLWSSGFQFGDWLDPDSPPDRPGDARTDPGIIATAYFARSADIVARTATILGKDKLASQYAALAKQVRDAFAREFTTANGRVSSDTPTAYALAIEFGLLPDEDRRHHAGARLAQLVRERGYLVSTGFIGTPHVCDALCEDGRYAAAFQMLTRKACPSWLYPVTIGATTIWERWNSLLPDGTVNPGDTTSFNHYALGAIADWLHRVVGGLAARDPGYRELELRPQIGGGLTRAVARLRTPYGIAECGWERNGTQIRVHATVPANAVGRMTLPLTHADPIEIGSGTHVWEYLREYEHHQPLSIDSTLSELFSDAETWERLVTLVPGVACLADITQISSRTTIREQLAFVPQGESLVGLLATALPELDG